MPDNRTPFEKEFDEISRVAHRVAIEKGWHEKDRNDGEMIALMHAELSEALEALRNTESKSEHIPKFSAIEEELADVVIRIMDYAELRRLNISSAIVEKIAYNMTRDHKHGGKKF